MCKECYLWTNARTRSPSKIQQHRLHRLTIIVVSSPFLLCTQSSARHWCATSSLPLKSWFQRAWWKYVKKVGSDGKSEKIGILRRHKALQAGMLYSETGAIGSGPRWFYLAWAILQSPGQTKRRLLKLLKWFFWREAEQYRLCDYSEGSRGACKWFGICQHFPALQEMGGYDHWNKHFTFLCSLVWPLIESGLHLQSCAI